MIDLFSSSYLSPVHFYARLYHSEHPMMEACCCYVKQTYRNRALIASANGATALSIPVERSGGEKCFTKDIRLSDHDNWRRLHWQAIVSAYGSSPFFEYYRDDIEPFYTDRFAFLFDFNEGLMQTILSLLHLPKQIGLTTEYIPHGDLTKECRDFREVIHPKKETSVVDPAFVAQPYYQVFFHKLGFIPNLSIIDLLFNMGPESLIVLRDSIKP